MSLWLMLIHLAGAVALLLWAVRMVRTGVERAHGAVLRRTLRQSQGGRVQAAGAGALVAVLLQSSTAVAVLSAGFAAGGILSGAMALSMLLGADVGSALVVQILSYDLSMLVPILLIAGGALFIKGTKRNVKQTGRILIGVALILVALGMISAATEPMRESTSLPVVVSFLHEEFFTAFLLGAAFTWLTHSSIASILLIMTFAAMGVVPLELGLSLMLGANLGAGLIAVGLTRGSSAEERRIPLGNLICRGTAALAAVVALQIFELPLELAGSEPARQIVIMHLAFNLALVVVFLPLAGFVSAIVERMIPDVPGEAEATNGLAERVSALDRSVLGTPGQALACATREVLYMSDIVDQMIRPAIEQFESGEKETIKRIRRLGNEVNRVHSDIKLYIADLNRKEMTGDEARRGVELVNFAINLEHVGDIVGRNLLPLAAEMRSEQLVFSKEGWKELTDLHDRVMANMQLALNVLVSSDRDSARQLVEEKDALREMERRSHNRHLKRLQSGTVKSVETSEIHLETIRALKQINSLFSSVAYPILADAGDLLDSRLAASS